MLALQIIFWTSILALFHTYVVYPLLVRMLATGKTDNDLVYKRTDALPGLTIVIPAHNEESVIREKLIGILASDYPQHLIEVLVGSDASTDNTNNIVRALCEEHSNVRLIEFTRRGKPSILNELVVVARHELIILTDANVMLDVPTLFELVKHFCNPAIALVESNMIHRSARSDGIGPQESAYLRGDAEVKRAEGILWGTLMGPAGGCYAVRRGYYVPVPSNFLVDDFYINMKVLAQRGKAIYEERAVVYEDVSNIFSEAFNRKVRIATGDFQNLAAFLPQLLRVNALSFSFLSHKVLRWIGPLLLLGAYFSSLILLFADSNSVYGARSIYFVGFLGLNTLFLFPALDWLMKKAGLHVFTFRLLSYFCSVNLALLVGMYRFIVGVKSGIWKPTERNQ